MREKLRISQRELAEKCGWFSQSRISHYEQDSREPVIKDIEQIAKALQVTMEWLLYGKEEDASMQDAPLSFREYPLLTISQIDEWLRNSTLTVQQRSVKMPSIGNEGGAAARSYVVDLTQDAFVTALYSFKLPNVRIFALYDPDHTWAPNDIVIADIPDEGKQICQVVLNGEQLYLKPFDNIFPTQKLTEKIKIIGVLRGMYQRLEDDKREPHPTAGI